MTQPTRDLLSRIEGCKCVCHRMKNVFAHCFGGCCGDEDKLIENVRHLLDLRPQIIVAVAKNPLGLIGVNGSLPWKKPADLRRFKQKTLDGTLIMGRKTWESIGRPLPGRRTIVLSRQVGFAPEGAEVSQTLEGAILNGTSPVWIVGGSEVYSQALLLVGGIDLTQVDGSFVGVGKRTFFPVSVGDLPGLGFSLTSEEPDPDDATLTHRTYRRT